MLITFLKVLMQCNHLFKQLRKNFIKKLNIIISDLHYFLEKKRKTKNTSYFSIL